MSIRPAPLPVQFSGGVELRQDAKQVPSTKLIDLQNAVFTKQTTISKRNGYRKLSTQIQNAGGDIANARGLAERDAEILLFTDKRAFSYRDSSDRWSDTGEVAATTVTTLPIARTGTLQTQPDVAERNGIRVIAWEDSRGGVWCSIIEIDSGRILQSQTQLDSAALARNPRCLPVDDVIHVLWTREDLGAIQIAIVNPAAPSVAPVVSTLTNDLGGPFTYDAESARLASQFIAIGSLLPGLIVWSITGGWRIGYIHGSGVLGSPLTHLPSVVTYSDAVAGSMAVTADWVIQGLITVAWISGSAIVKARLVSSSNFTLVQDYAQLGVGAAAYSRLTICNGGTPGTNSSDQELTLFWAAEIPGARTDLCVIESGKVNLTDAPAARLLSTKLRGHNLVSRAWYVDPDLSPTIDPVTGNFTLVGDVYVGVAHTVQFFPYVAALRLSEASGIASPNAVIVSRLLPSEATGALMRPASAGTRSWTTHLPSALAIGQLNSEFWTRQRGIPLGYRIQLSSQNGDQFSEQGIKLAAINFDAQYQTAQLGRGLYLASSAPMHYDGDAWHEADFHTAPDIGFDTAGAPFGFGTTIAIGGAAGNIANGTYVYAFWYEAVDAQGELHRSATSVKILLTMVGGPLSVIMLLPTCKLTRFSNVRICVARSAQGAIGTDSTLPLYKVTSNDVTIKTGNNRYVDNDPTVDGVAFDDALSDAELIKREPLYTNGGILPNACSPWAGGVIAASKSRLFWTDPTDPNVVRYSQQIADDTALEAPIDLSLRKDPLGGGITAIGVLDDTIVPFSETATFVFGGPGPLADPTAAPEANAFSPIELVTSDVGCISPASLCQAPLGITFQSRKGIKLLTRQREVADIGNPVEPLNDQIYSRSTLLPDRKSILYLTSTPGGFSLLWDYDRNQWSKFSNHVGLDAIVVGGVYQYLRTDSRVFVETPGLYKDDNSHIPMLIETAWIHFAQYLQGWQRILYAYFLGSYLSPHQLLVRYRINYNEGYSPAILSDVNANYSPSLYGSGTYGAGAYGGPGLSGARYQRRIHFNKRCQSISFLISDLEAPDDFGATFELSEMLLIGGGIGPDFKVGAARSA